MMTSSGRIVCKVAVVTVFCVLAIFLCPAVQGPYSAVNGPVTVLQASRAAARLHLAIIQVAVRILGTLRAAPLNFFSWLSLARAEQCSGSLPDCAMILRC